MEPKVIESEDYPIYSLRLMDSGPNPGAVFSLIRLLTRATPACARDILRTPGSEIARDCRMALQHIARQYEKAGATLFWEVVEL